MSVQPFKLNFPHYDLLFVMKQEKGYCYMLIVVRWGLSVAYLLRHFP